VFFLALKLIKKFVKAMIWLVKLPIRITMKLAGAANSDDSGSVGSRTNTKTRTTTETARTGTAPSESTGTATTDRQQAAAKSTSAAAAGGAAATVPADTLSKYQRFRQSLLAFAVLSVLSPLWLIVSADLLAYGFGGEFLIGMVIGSAIPAGLWYWTRQRSRLAWGVAMAYAVIQLLLSLVGTSALAVAVPGGSAFGQRPVLALLQLASLAALGAVLYFGATGRDAVGQPAAVAPEATGAAGGAGASTTASDTSSAAGGTTQQSSSVSESTTSAGTASQSDESRTTSTASSADDAPAAAAAASATSDDGTAATTTDTTDQTEPAAATADTTTEEAGAAATAADEVLEDDEQVPENTDEIAPLLDDLRAEPAEPETVRELGETLSTTDPSAEVVETLDRCSRADDPEVRVAVCDVCADLDGPEPESILQRLRIDTNDRVATTAMDAL
jgi:hypothetical protein